MESAERVVNAAEEVVSREGGREGEGGEGGGALEGASLVKQRGKMSLTGKGGLKKG